MFPIKTQWNAVYVTSRLGCLKKPVTEILVCGKFWSGGPKFPENLVGRTSLFREYWSACEIMVRAQILRCKHTLVSKCLYIVS